MSNLFIPEHLKQSRDVPDWFRIALHEIDPSLIVYYNPLRCRWIIDRCTAGGEHGTANHQHTPECPRTNVKVVQDEVGNYMPLCDDILDWLRAHDTWSQHSTSEQFITVLANQDLDYKEKLRAIRRANTRHATLDGKIQIQKAKNLIDQHSLEVNQ